MLDSLTFGSKHTKLAQLELFLQRIVRGRGEEQFYLDEEALPFHFVYYLKLGRREFLVSF